MNEFTIVSNRARRIHEELNEGIVRTNNNLLVLLFFANDFSDKSAAEHATSLKADLASVMIAARTLQGYGYIYIDIREGRNRLVATPKGSELVKKLRENMKKRQ